MNNFENLRVAFGLKRFIGLALMMLFAMMPVYAVAWCHDYTLYKVTCQHGACENRNNMSPGELRRRLEESGYKRFSITNAAANPEFVQQYLKFGDVLILRDDHSGYVDSNRKITHFLQVFGESGQVRNPESLPEFPQSVEKKGGLFRSDSFRDFLGRPFYQGPIGSIELWRRGGGQTGTTTTTTNTGGQTTTQYTPAQIDNMRQWIAYYDNLIAQWTNYRDRQVVPYWNHPTYYQWARNEYAKSNQTINNMIQWRAYYQKLLTDAGIR